MIRKIARPMLASVFVIDGVQTVINPASAKEGAEAVLKQLRAATPRQYRAFLPKDPETAAQIVGGVKAGAASLFALGKAPRTAAALLTATQLASLVGRNAFWDTDDADEKNRRRAGALTDLALTGGVLLATVDTAGKPDMMWRAQHAAKTAKKNVQQALPTQSETEKALSKASNWLSDATDQVGEYIDDNKGDWKKAASKAGDAAQDFLGDARKQTSKFLSNAGDWIDDAADEAQDKYKDLKPSKIEQYKAKRKVNSLVGDAQDWADDARGWAEDAWDNLTPSKLQKLKAKHKVNSVVSDLQGQLDDLTPSKLDKLKAKRKVNKASAKLQGKAQDAVDTLEDAWNNLDASPSYWQKRKWKKRVNKAEKKAKKAVKKAQKKLG